MLQWCWLNTPRRQPTATSIRNGGSAVPLTGKHPRICPAMQWSRSPTGRRPGQCPSSARQPACGPGSHKPAMAAEAGTGTFHGGKTRKAQQAAIPALPQSLPSTSPSGRGTYCWTAPTAMPRPGHGALSRPTRRAPWCCTVADPQRPGSAARRQDSAQLLFLQLGLCPSPRGGNRNAPHRPVARGLPSRLDGPRRGRHPQRRHSNAAGNAGRHQAPGRESLQCVDQQSMQVRVRRRRTPRGVLPHLPRISPWHCPPQTGTRGP